MKIKYKNIEAEMRAEDLAERIIDNSEKDWKEKLEAKSNAKKELLELKHKNKMEEQILKRMDEKDLKHYYKEKNKSIPVEESESNFEKSKKIIKISSILMFFVYGLFCILGFQNHHIISAIISFIQILLTVISLLISMDFFHIFKNDYKLFFIISILLIIPWLAFAV